MESYSEAFSGTFREISWIKIRISWAEPSGTLIICMHSYNFQLRILYFFMKKYFVWCYLKFAHFITGRIVYFSGSSQHFCHNSSKVLLAENGKFHGRRFFLFGKKTNGLMLPQVIISVKSYSWKFCCRPVKILIFFHLTVKSARHNFRKFEH